MRQKYNFTSFLSQLIWPPRNIWTCCHPYQPLHPSRSSQPSSDSSAATCEAASEPVVTTQTHDGELVTILSFVHLPVLKPSSSVTQCSSVAAL